MISAKAEANTDARVKALQKRVYKQGGELAGLRSRLEEYAKRTDRMIEKLKKALPHVNFED